MLHPNNMHINNCILNLIPIIFFIFHIPQDAIVSPNRYALKPIRGNGPSIWGQEIAQKLRTFGQNDRAWHILMQKLKPMVSQVSKKRIFEFIDRNYQNLKDINYKIQNKIENIIKFT